MNKKLRKMYYESSSDKIVCGVGYIGIGKYTKQDKQYVYWNSMLKRSYSNYTKESHPSYEGCTVCDEWHNYQIFAKWFEDNYYEVDSCRMELDKDILTKGNKVYSPITCTFTPNKINNLFTKRQNHRGSFPIGVHLNKVNGKYISRCMNQITKKRVSLGHYETESFAFLAYKQYKENHIKEVADYYKSEIPKKLYDAMYKYKIDITD